MALVGPPPVLDSGLLSVLLRDIRDERAANVAFPPGETSFSLARTRRVETEPLELLLECYERFGPIFTLRLLHGNVVFMLGPAANHYLLVSNASNFTWREGHFRDLIALMGDGLLTIDGEFHRRSRLIMLPAFHRETSPRPSRRSARRPAPPSRTCIGMRFGQLEVRAIATLILSRVTLSVPEDFRPQIHQMPTISPKDGLPVSVRPRPAAAQPTVAETLSL